MSFISLQFLAFMLIMLILYYVLPIKARKYVLLLGSLSFYAFSGPVYLLYLVAVALFSYVGAKAIDNAGEKRGKALFLFVISVSFILGILAVVKYSAFVVENINRLEGVDLLVPSIIMPLGLSYYTFSSLGYMSDVYHGKYVAEKNFFNYLLFISYFPQIIQGPIPRYDQLVNQFETSHYFNWNQVKSGLQLVIWGLFKKMVIADGVSKTAGLVRVHYEAMNTCEIMFCMLLWGVQIYTDFSGGVDIARGVSECFGIELLKNFERPYFSTSLRDYWNRWHISLSHWMRDYVFYPIAFSKGYSRFSRKLKKRFGKEFSRNLPLGLVSVLLFTLIGLWHGANWGEILFGLVNGVLICLSSILEPLFKKVRIVLSMDSLVVWKLFRIVRTVLIITFARFFSFAKSIDASIVMFRNVFTGFTRPFSGEISISLIGALPVMFACFVLLAVSLIEENTEKKSIRVLLAAKPQWFSLLLALSCIMYIILFGNYGMGFEAADFVYSNY